MTTDATIQEQAQDVTVSKPPTWYSKILDSFELWLAKSGYLDSLSTLVTSSTTVRTFVVGLAGSAVAHGILKGEPTEYLISGSVFVIMWVMNAFITHVRNKYSSQAQKALGIKNDKFFGPKSQDALVKAVDAVPDTKVASLSGE